MLTCLFAEEIPRHLLPVLRRDEERVYSIPIRAYRRRRRTQVHRLQQTRQMHEGDQRTGVDAAAAQMLKLPQTGPRFQYQRSQ